MNAPELKRKPCATCGHFESDHRPLCVHPMVDPLFVCDCPAFVERKPKQIGIPRGGDR